jgi:hypothetical protein
MRFAVLASLAVLVAGSSLASADPVSVNGSWAGEMRQVDVDNETRYPMTLTLKGKTGETSYPTLNCGGALTKIADTKGGYAIYQERITNEPGGTCIDGVVLVTTDAGKLVLGWFATFEGAPAVATAVLRKGEGN